MWRNHSLMGRLLLLPRHALQPLEPPALPAGPAGPRRHPGIWYQELARSRSPGGDAGAVGLLFNGALLGVSIQVAEEPGGRSPLTWVLKKYSASHQSTGVSHSLDLVFNSIGFLNNRHGLSVVGTLDPAIEYGQG